MECGLQEFQLAKIEILTCARQVLPFLFYRRASYFCQRSKAFLILLFVTRWGPEAFSIDWFFFLLVLSTFPAVQCMTRLCPVLRLFTTLLPRFIDIAAWSRLSHIWLMVGNHTSKISIDSIWYIGWR